MTIFLLFCFLAAFCDAEDAGITTKASSSSGGSVVKSSDDQLPTPNRGSTQQSSKTFHLPLTNVDNSQYYGIIRVGILRWGYKVAFDMGSPNLWIPSRSCRSSSCQSSSDTKDNFDISIKYQSGTFKGVVKQNTVRVAGIMVKNFKFAEITTGPSSFFDSLPYDGVIGLGHSRDSDSGDYLKSFFSQAVEQGDIDSEVFSFYLGSDSKAKVGGELTIGGVNSNYYKGEITYTPVKQKDSFSIDIEGISIGKKEICDKDTCSGVVDTSSKYMMGPKKEIKKINDVIQAKMSQTYGMAIVDCSKTNELPDVTITIANRKFVITPQQYVLPPPFSFMPRTSCVSGFLGDDTEGSNWTLGQIFVRAYYTVFDLDKNQVGFATAKAPPSQ